MPGIREECVLRSNVGFMALHGGSQDRGPNRSPGGPPRKPVRRTTPSCIRPGCGSTSPRGCTIPPTRRSCGFLRARGRRHLGARVRARRLCPVARSGPGPRSSNRTDPQFGETDRAVAGDHCGRAERATARRDAGCSSGGSPATTSPTSGYGSDFIPTTRSTFPRPMVSRSSYPRVYAESAISARSWFPDRTGW